MNKSQHKLFDSIKRLSDDVRSLSAFVQNDFEEMLTSGYITPEEIKHSTEEVAIHFDRCSTVLTNLKTDVLTLMAKYSHL